MNARALGLAALCFGGCATVEVPRPKALGDKTSSTPQAVVMIEGRSGSSLGGYAEFEREGALVKLTVAVTGVPPGLHAVHLHEFGDCSAPDALSAGGHWNPSKDPHGQLEHGAAHLGDIGNVEVKPDGTGRFTFVTANWTVATGLVNDVMGRALVIHALADDFVTQPTGNAAGRIGCGVVVKPRDAVVAEPVAHLR